MSDISAMTTKLMETVYHSCSPEETVDFARSIAQKYAQEYSGGACFYLEGDLGAGKTLFAKGIASAYGVDPAQVVSPTFALVNRYGEGSLPVYHIDLYRIETERELIELGLEEIEDERATMIVEWPEKLGRYRRKDAVTVSLTVLDEESRQITINEPNEKISGVKNLRGEPRNISCRWGEPDADDWPQKAERGARPGATTNKWRNP